MVTLELATGRTPPGHIEALDHRTSVVAYTSVSQGGAGGVGGPGGVGGVGGVGGGTTNTTSARALSEDKLTPSPKHIAKNFSSRS